MAKSSRYFQDNYPGLYDEGPYVLCQHPMTGLYRLEQQGDLCSIYPGETAIQFMKDHGLPPGWYPFEKIAPIVDVLNQMEKGRG